MTAQPCPKFSSQAAPGTLPPQPGDLLQLSLAPPTNGKDVHLDPIMGGDRLAD